jgi:hypothetical protein
MTPAIIRDPQFRAVFRAEFMHFSRDPVVFRGAILVPCSVLFAVWEYSGSPLVPALGSALAILEPRINNFLYTSPQEGEALSLLPSHWRSVVAAKNLASALLLFLLLVLLGIPIGFFAAHPAGEGGWGEAALCLLTMVFPLLHLGNLHALQHPRREAGWSLGDLSEVILLLITAGVAAIPYAILSSLPHGTLWCLLYAAAGALFWWRISLPHVERLLRTGRVPGRAGQ